MNNVFEPSLALSDITDILITLDFDYFLVGSFASGFRGEFRATNDLDIVCAFKNELINNFIDLSKKNFYCDEQSIPEAILNRTSFNLIHEKTFVKIDFFTRISQFEEEQFKLASDLVIPTTEKKVKVSTTEYNIVAKLNWYLKSNRVLDRQISDVKSMIKINFNNLDLDYIKKWTNSFNTFELFEEIYQSIKK